MDHRKSTKLTAVGKVSRPKRSATCPQRLLGGSVLSGNACMIHNADATASRVVVLAEEALVPKLMIRSSGNVKGGAYYRGGNGFLANQVESHAVDQITAGRTVIPRKSGSQFSNQHMIIGDNGDVPG